MITRQILIDTYPKGLWMGVCPFNTFLKAVSWVIVIIIFKYPFIKCGFSIIYFFFSCHFKQPFLTCPQRTP